jgi:hypothetical protein
MVQLRLTASEFGMLAALAHGRDITVERLIRDQLGLRDPPPNELTERHLVAVPLDSAA